MLKALDHKISSDLLWNFLSLLVQAVSWIALHLTIVWHYDPKILGVFNQGYAVYMVSSMIASFGIPKSTLKHIAQFVDERMLCNRIITSAFLLTLLPTIIATGLVGVGSSVIGRLTDSPEVGTAIRYSLGGLFFFSINKLLLAVLNGFEHMKAFAVFNALRSLGLLVGIASAVFIELDGIKLTAIFTFTEVLLFIPLFHYTKRFFIFTYESADWLRTHFFFGLKGLVAGVVTELNSKVDILMLGVFMTDTHVGVYSLAAFLIEGSFQITFVVQRVMNPKLTSFIYSGRLGELEKIIRKGGGYTAAVMIPVYGLLVAGLSLMVSIFIPLSNYRETVLLLFILAMGAAVQSMCIPFGMLMLQGGYPGFQSLLALSVLVTNIVLNMIFIPLLGTVGAAAATSLSFVCYVLYYKILARRLFELRV